MTDDDIINNTMQVFNNAYKGVQIKNVNMDE